MQDLSKNALKAVMIILKSPEKQYNAHTLAQVLSISAMGALKILKQLERVSVLKAEKIANARFYRVNLQHDYAQEYVTFALAREAATAAPQVKRWIKELQKIKHAELGILFGSVLRKKEPKDIDVLLVTDQKKFSKLKKEIEQLNAINVKPIHPVFQSYQDLVKNIKQQDPVVLNAIKGVIVFGAETWLRAYHESCKE